MGDGARVSLQTLVQGFIFSLQVEGKVPATVSYYQGNLRLLNIGMFLIVVLTGVWLL
jgi:hypothetical protein